MMRRWGEALSFMDRDTFTGFISEDVAADSSHHADINGCDDISALNVQHFYYGEFQSCHEIDLCLPAFSKLFKIDTYRNLLTNTDIDAIAAGGIPSSWLQGTRFTSEEIRGPLDLPFLCGSWYNGSMHFVTLYICRQYWTILDPLQDHRQPPFGMSDDKLHASLGAYYSQRGINTPDNMPRYRRVPRIAIQCDLPKNPWSCGTHAMLAAIHFFLGAPPPHLIPPESITQDMVYSFHSMLQYWHLMGHTPNVWAADCLATSFCLASNSSHGLPLLYPKSPGRMERVRKCSWKKGPSASAPDPLAARGFYRTMFRMSTPTPLIKSSLPSPAGS